MSDEGGNFFTEFLNDFYAESEEHLAAVRRQLLGLETGQVARGYERAVFEELLRSFHSLKGLSAMVSAHDVEQLAHCMEDYLRGLETGKLILAEEGMEALSTGTDALERLISARREGTGAPDTGPVLTQFASLAADARRDAILTTAKSAPPSGSSTDAVGEQMLRFNFHPTPELGQSGVNVNTVRAKLQNIGRILEAAPRVNARGAIAFEFIVASNHHETEFADWIAEGIHCDTVTTPLQSDATQNAGVSDSPTGGSSKLQSAPNVVRVNMIRLDELMTMVGDLVISRGRLEENLKTLESVIGGAEWRSLQDLNRTMENQLRNLREGVMRVRMVPIGQVFERMQFVIRSLERESRKEIQLELSGHETEVDKHLVERMMDPLLHLVRNAVTHGVEPAQERVARGKTPEGHLRLSASTRGETIVIELEDDGQGIDAEEVTRRARSVGLLGETEALDEAGLLNMICSPGFSTRTDVDLAAGRGVGMAVVKSTVSELGGNISMSTRLGEGTRFTIQLPLTLAILDAVIVAAGNQRFAAPQSAVREVFRVESENITFLERNQIIRYHDTVLPLLMLSDLFNLGAKPAKAHHVFVVGADSNPVGIVVDRILGQREIVVRSVNDPLVHVPGVAGASELGDGRPILILDVPALLDLSRRQKSART